MQIKFQLQERLTGFCLATAGPGETVPVQTTELLGPADAINLAMRLDGLDSCLFQRIPGLPSPSQIDHLLILIKHDLSAIAYVNELQVMARVKLAEGATATKGEPVFISHVADIASIDLGVEIPPDNAVVVMRSFGWKRSLFFDFRPLDIKPEPRPFPIDQVLAQQALLLLGLPISADAIGLTGKTRLDHMTDGLNRLKKLLADKCAVESEYQTLLVEHPWMLGGAYSSVDRHLSLDDENVPDFTAVRCHDHLRDIIELKHPFLPCTKKDGGFSSQFNDAWNQVERYLVFTQKQRQYLAEQKNLRFENPSCLLLFGHGLTDDETRQVREKESNSRVVRVLTYDHLLSMAEHVLTLTRSAGEDIRGTLWLLNKTVKPEQRHVSRSRKPKARAKAKQKRRKRKKR